MNPDMLFKSFIHKKTGNLYVVVAKATNATNEQSGQEMVVYTRKDIENAPFYVRELNEFQQKFEEVP